VHSSKYADLYAIRHSDTGGDPPRLFEFWSQGFDRLIAMNQRGETFTWEDIDFAMDLGAACAEMWLHIDGGMHEMATGEKVIRGGQHAAERTHGTADERERKIAERFQAFCIAMKKTDGCRMKAYEVAARQCGVSSTSIRNAVRKKTAAD